MMDIKMIEFFRKYAKARELFPIQQIKPDGFDDDESEAYLGYFNYVDPPDTYIPVIHKEFIYNEETFESDLEEAVKIVANNEDRLLFSGETKNWKALGIEGLSTASGRNVMAASGDWNESIIVDILGARELLPQNKTQPLLIVPPHIGLGLNKILWRDINHLEPPISFRNYLINQKILCGIITTDQLYSHRGTKDSVLLVIPGRENFYAVQGFPLEAKGWKNDDGERIISIREGIVPVIKKPETIVEITYVYTV